MQMVSKKVGRKGGAEKTNDSYPQSETVPGEVGKGGTACDLGLALTVLSQNEWTFQPKRSHAHTPVRARTRNQTKRHEALKPKDDPANDNQVIRPGWI